jgi:hypothetical protein
MFHCVTCLGLLVEFPCMMQPGARQLLILLLFCLLCLQACHVLGSAFGFQAINAAQEHSQKVRHRLHGAAPSL